MKTLSITRPDGARLAIRDHAPTSTQHVLLLSNSLATNASLWDDQIPTLSQTLRIVTYDTRGHGESTAPSAQCTLQTLADDLIAVLDAVGVQKTSLLGSRSEV